MLATDLRVLIREVEDVAVVPEFFSDLAARSPSLLTCATCYC